MTKTNENIENRRKRLLYRASYRGFKEADIVIGGFAEANLPTMSEDELDEFEALIALQDKDLYDWLMGKRPAPANIIGPVFERMCAFDAAARIREITAL